MSQRSISVVGFIGAVLCLAAPHLGDINLPSPAAPTAEIKVTPLQAEAVSAITAELDGDKESAREFAALYLELADSVDRDTEGKIYPTTVAFRAAHSRVLYVAFQNTEFAGKHNVSDEINDAIRKIVGTDDAQKIDASMRSRIVDALEAVAWGFQQV